ncbi:MULTISPECIES: DNA-processing protein DprA [Acinetobacter]|uniref:DNA-processing protein DprA n=1 Tax=Acinetobacter TaxID=469 RepID=UPI000CECA93A|nr:MULTISPECIES: DNA-processing protein DprA [Acinetobacter]TMS47688.1 DNA processing protein DprA [Acinetobacter lwoffii]
MREEDIAIPPHYIFLGLMRLNGVGFQTLYNFFAEGKQLSDLMLTENIDDFITFLGRSFDITSCDLKDWGNFLNNIIESGRNYFESLASRQIKFLLCTDYQFPEFPPKMKMPIYWLFIQGNLENLYIANSLTLIGSRESTITGSFLAQTLLYGVGSVKEKIVTISGLAAGIDQIVHEISLHLGIPTIAILGNGLNENYPANSKALRQDILDAGGTIVTEYFPDMKPSKEAFVNRNRIQAALAKTVIPLEWKEKSGTAHTIRYASEMGKKICYVETSKCREFFTEHALANSAAQRKYGGDIFILPNAFNQLCETLDLTIDTPIVIKVDASTAEQESKVFKQPEQIGLDLF